MASAFRDPSKDPETETEAHYIAAKRPLELAALRLSLPDETLSLMRYTIAPLFTADEDKKKPWLWVKHLKTHYTGSCSSKLTDRYNFSALNQSSSESMKEWEIKVRQAGHLCEYKGVWLAAETKHAPNHENALLGLVCVQRLSL